MKRSMIVFLICLFPIISFSQKPAEYFSFPAEFEKHDAIWMGWRTTTTRGIDKSETLLRIIKSLTPYIKVNLFVDHDSTIETLQKEFRKIGINKNRVQMFVFPNPYSNVRDPGPVFLRSNKGNLMIADMKWSFYGEAPGNSSAAKRIDSIDWYVARKLNLPVRTSTLISEGGAREFNGKGVMMAVESTEMHRNKGWSRDSIEKELLRMFGQEKIIWLKKALAEDDPLKYELPSGTLYTFGINHIDEFCRFASSNTILLAEVTKDESLKDTLHKISYERLQENIRILKSVTDQNGKPFKVLRVPAAEMMTRTYRINSNDTASIKKFNLAATGGDVTYYIATSYLNFLVTNGIVLMASYWKPGRPDIIRQKDNAAKNIIQLAFPGRKIIQINVEVLNQGMGGIHCATQQQPAVIKP